jgi:hypothetical protein
MCDENELSVRERLAAKWCTAVPDRSHQVHIGEARARGVSVRCTRHVHRHRTAASTHVADESIVSIPSHRRPRTRAQPADAANAV